MLGMDLNLPWSLEKYDSAYIVLDSTGSVVCSKQFQANINRPEEPHVPPDAGQMEYLVAAANAFQGVTADDLHRAIEYAQSPYHELHFNPEISTPEDAASVSNLDSDDRFFTRVVRKKADVEREFGLPEGFLTYKPTPENHNG